VAPSRGVGLCVWRNGWDAAGKFTQHVLSISLLFYIDLPLLGFSIARVQFWNVGATGADEPVARVPFAHDMAIWDMSWHPVGHMLATVSNDCQTKFWTRNRVGSTAGLPAPDEVSGGAGAGSVAVNAATTEVVEDEIELGTHVGIVIGRRGQTIISIQRATGTKMHVDQVRRTLLIQGTPRQIEIVKKRVGALLDRVSNEERQQQQQQQYGPGGSNF
jgi:KH domain